MKARGLDEAGPRGVLPLAQPAEGQGDRPARRATRSCDFATRQSPTTGATIPVDGGLPDATPRVMLDSSQ
ncbi:MAG: hypothetical protein MZU84_04750 [Sphingobacterium sp.]|nr:hypothetical protein [Sphingobacterium sp.]